MEYRLYAESGVISVSAGLTTTLWWSRRGVRDRGRGVLIRVV